VSLTVSQLSSLIISAESFTDMARQFVSSDVRRKNALDDWLAKLTDAENAVQLLKSACLDTRFLDRTIIPSRISSRSTISFESMCLAFEENLHRFESLHSELQLARATVSNVRNKSITLTPIHRLPNELLQMIFLLASFDDKGVGPYCISTKVPHLASKVCRKWRDVCRETSVFWTLLRFNDSPTFHWTSLCIQRAGGRPLSVDINDDSSRSFDIDSVLPHLNNIVSQVGWLRLSECSLRQTNLILSLFLHTPHADVRLKSLILCSVTRFDYEDDEQEYEERECRFYDLLDKCLRRHQQIEELSLSGVQLKRPPPIPTALISLHICGGTFSSIDQFDILLRSCTTLQNLSWDNCVVRVDVQVENSGSEEYLLPHLSTLALKSMADVILTRLTQRLVAPRLESLTVDRLSQEERATLCALIDRCGHSAIKVLELQYWEEGLEDMLATCPTPKLSFSRTVTSGTVYFVC
jgi:hypothetical protein